MEFRLSPQARFIALIIVAILLLLLIIILFVFNKGRVAFEGERPFTVTIEGYKTLNCNQDNDCELTLAAGNYQVIARKNDFFTIQKELQVGFNSSSNVDLEFVPRPSLGKLTELSASDVKILENTTLGLDQETLNSIKELLSEYEDYQELLISPDQKYIILNTGNEVFAAQLDSKSDFKELPLSPTDSYAFGGDNHLYFLSNQRFSKNQLFQELIVGRYSSQEIDQIPSLTAFLQTIDNARIIPNPSNQKFIIIDLDNSETELYLFNQVNSTRTKIQSLENISNAKWINDNSFLAEVRKAGRAFPELIYYDFEKEEIIDINSNLDLIEPIDEQNMFAVIPGENAEFPFQLVNFNLPDQTASFILNLEARPVKIEIDQSGKLLVLVNNQIFTLTNNN
ncbi:hypothetical protein GF376_02500 [Candidatus Peregrinibacteria bacterium]|nr:hypothetical protein [Candidatus Peregrinibacteria bacterium]